MNPSANDWTAWFIRTAVVGVATVVIGVLSYFGNRIVDHQDKTESSLHKLEAGITDVKQDISQVRQEMILRRQAGEARDDRTKSMLLDHETRIRSLERKP